MSFLMPTELPLQDRRHPVKRERSDILAVVIARGHLHGRGWRTNDR